MPTLLPRQSRRLTAAMAALALISCAGCVPTVAWLPDSSGFVYTEEKDGKQLVHFDLAKGKPRVLVADTKANTARPAISPDGKRIAVARETQRPKEPRTLQVAVYDFEGKELQRSKEFTSRIPDNHRPLLHLYWAPEGDKLLIDRGDSVSIYDLKTDTLLTKSGSLPTFGGNPIRPSGRGFLLLGKEMSYVDWQGTGQELDVAARLSNRLGFYADSRITLSPVIHNTRFHSTRWEGEVAIVNWSRDSIRFDITEGTVTLQDIEPELTGDKEVIQHQHQFPDGSPTVRLVELEKRSDKGGGLFRIEVIRSDKKQAAPIVDKSPLLVQFLPAPNKKLLALDCLIEEKPKKWKRRIIVVNSKGDVVANIEPNLGLEE